MKLWHACALVVAIALQASTAIAQPSLGSAGTFGVLGATTVTNTGPTVVTGNLGVSPGTAITGFLPAPANTIAGPGTVTPGLGLVTGTIYAGGLVAARAHADAFIADESIKAMECLPANNLTGQDLGTLILPPGTYCFNSSAQLTGTLVLAGSGPWVFKIGSTLTTATASAVLVPDVSTCAGANVFWQVGSSATLGTATQFVGNVLATTSITATAGVTVSGSLLAINGAVTLDTNEVSACGARVPPPPDPDDDDDDDECKCKCKHHHHGEGNNGGGHDKDCDKDHGNDDNDKNKDKKKCNQGVGNGSEGCDPGKSNNHKASNDERGGKPGSPGRKPGGR